MKPDGYAVIASDGHFVGIWRDEAIAHQVKDRSPSAKGERVEPMKYAQPPVARPLAEWHEDHGNVLWWKVPISEPPFCGTPLDSDWPEDYYTHWTPLEVPNVG